MKRCCIYLALNQSNGKGKGIEYGTKNHRTMNKGAFIKGQNGMVFSWDEWNMNDKMRESWDIMIF